MFIVRASLAGIDLLQWISHLTRWDTEPQGLGIDSPQLILGWPNSRSALCVLFKSMRKILQFLLLLGINVLGATGCSSGSRGKAPGLVILVPGVAGDGSWYRNVAPALRELGDERTVESFSWGAPGFAFFLNFNNTSIHESAEKKLAQRITKYRAEHPNEPLDIVAHSAGGGVTLGALAKLPADIRVRHILLLHPSVSPAYPLAKPLAGCDSITLFHSAGDKTFLDWRTSHFGTYDNIKTKAAGNAGFDLSGLDPSLRRRVTVIPFTETDRSLGNDGEHFGALARAYLVQRVLPIIAINDAAPAPESAATAPSPPNR